MEINESIFGKNHGKLAHLRNLAPKIIYVGGKLTGKKSPQRSLEYLGPSPLGIFFMDAVKEKYYLVGNYDDQYMRWTTLHQERGKTVLEFTNTFHTLRTKLGIKYLEQHLVLKYPGDLQKCIQT
jgi:hypothetical protein